MSSPGRAGRALRWALTHGWRRTGGPRSFRNGSTVVTLTRSWVIVHRAGSSPVWMCPATTDEAVELLAALQVLPTRFSALGDRALGEFAEVCERYATHIHQHHQDVQTAAVLQSVAASARTMAAPS